MVCTIIYNIFLMFYKAIKLIFSHKIGITILEKQINSYIKNENNITTPFKLK
ncbi:hypothetical protein PIROE2DRAFT_1100 [Piromyces sp. E2]|nr:hypothetical protein PIROE2DRAFT_1100 [Piromyces sp. E2]|eukprot:OUM70582.1 hypothetical protein PIROE2DRAFT_1100 [Piromyces sp. E2]